MNNFRIQSSNSPTISIGRARIPRILNEVGEGKRWSHGPSSLAHRPRSGPPSPEHMQILQAFERRLTGPGLSSKTVGIYLILARNILGERPRPTDHLSKAWRTSLWADGMFFPSSACLISPIGSISDYLRHHSNQASCPKDLPRLQELDHLAQSCRNIGLQLFIAIRRVEMDNLRLVLAIDPDEAPSNEVMGPGNERLRHP